MNTFEKNIISIYGELGRKWLNDLPDILNKTSKKYNLQKLNPVNNMTYNYVASGFQNNKEIILKTGLDTNALQKEAKCLKALDNHSAVEIIADSNNMIIMKKAVPGVTLKSYFPDNDSKATEIFCSVIKSLHSVKSFDKSDFRSLNSLLNVLDKDLAIPDNIISKARSLKDSLLASTTQEVLLHGDLHHDNILLNNDEWLVIDPKGFVGDPIFEITAYLYNPIPNLLKNDAEQLIENRIKICVEKSGYNKKRILDWLYVKIVLCWAWSIEDNLDCSYWKMIESICNYSK